MDRKIENAKLETGNAKPDKTCSFQFLIPAFSRIQN